MGQAPTTLYHTLAQRPSQYLPQSPPSFSLFPCLGPAFRIRANCVGPCHDVESQGQAGPKRWREVVTGGSQGPHN